LGKTGQVPNIVKDKHVLVYWLIVRCQADFMQLEAQRQGILVAEAFTVPRFRNLRPTPPPRLAYGAAVLTGSTGLAFL